MLRIEARGEWGTKDGHGGATTTIIRRMLVTKEIERNSHESLGFTNGMLNFKEGVREGNRHAYG